MAYLCAVGLCLFIFFPLQVCECSVISPHLQQVYIAGATRACQTQGPCLQHASQAEQGSKLEELGGGTGSLVVGTGYITSTQGVFWITAWRFGKGLHCVKRPLAVWCGKGHKCENGNLNSLNFSFKNGKLLKAWVSRRLNGVFIISDRKLNRAVDVVNTEENYDK